MSQRKISTQDFRNRLQTASMNQRPMPMQRAPMSNSPMQRPMSNSPMTNMPMQPLKDVTGNPVVQGNTYIIKNVPDRAALNGQEARYSGNNTFYIGRNKIEIKSQGNTTFTPVPLGGYKKRTRRVRKMKKTIRRKTRGTRRR